MPGAVARAGLASGTIVPARLMAGGAALLGASVLADSAAEHYRGSFRNPAMVLPLASSALSIAVNLRQALPGRRRASDRLGWASHATAGAIGLAGFGFHLYNVGKQPGGYRINNLFYKAPLGAPGALVIAGAIGAGARLIGTGMRRFAPARLGSGRAMAALTAFGLAGTVAEAGFLHFRGAYHNPVMYLPVTLPPLAAASLAADVVADRPSRASFALLGATAAMGLVGAGFHAYGVSRNMGGWRNWRQNLLAGPPLPAPPSFTGIAVAAIGALLLMRRPGRG